MTVTLTAGGSDRWMVSSLVADALDDRDRVLAHRPPDVEHHRRGLRRARPRDVGRWKLSSAWPMSETRIGVPFFVATTMSLKSCGGVDAAERPQQQLPLALLDRAARDLDVLGDDRVAHLGHRQAVRVQLLDVDDDVDLAGAAAGEADLADAVDRLDRRGRSACRSAR